MRPIVAVLVSAMMLLLVFSVPESSGQSPYSALSDGPEGLGHHLDGPLSGARFQYGAFQDLDPQADALLVVGPRLGYTAADADAVRAFLSAGGRMLLADAGGSGRGLLAALDVGMDMAEAQVFSSSFQRSPAFPLVTSTNALPGLPASMPMHRPVVLSGAGVPVLETHPLTWLDENNNGRPDLDEPTDRYSTARLLPVGRGELLVVGDPDVLSLAMDDVAGEAATAMLSWLGDGRNVVVDEGHRARADPVGMAPLLAGEAPARAAVALAGALAIGVAWALGMRVRRVRVRRRRRPAPPPDRLLESALAELPP